MSNLIKRRRRLRRIIIALAAVGCTSATLSGTLAAMSPATHLSLPALAGRFA